MPKIRYQGGKPAQRMKEKGPIPVRVLLFEALKLLQHHLQRPVTDELYVLPANHLRPKLNHLHCTCHSLRF